MPDLEPDLPELLLRLLRALDPITEGALAVSRGATLSQLAVLRVLGRDELRVITIAERCGIHRSSASRMVDRLVTAGLATKRPSPTSGREVQIAATARGKAAARSVATHRRAALTELLAQLPAGQRADVAVSVQALLACVGVPSRGAS